MKWVTLCAALGIGLATLCVAKPTARARPSQSRVSKAPAAKFSHPRLTVATSGRLRSNHSSTRAHGEAVSFRGKALAVTSLRANGRWMAGRSGKKKNRWARVEPPRPPAPTYQLHPDEERYITIQKALADRGYFKGEANGQWLDDSVDALKRFQLDQKLVDDGKINSLSLIALGLGPKHDGSSLSSAVQPAGSVPAGSVAPVSLPALSQSSSVGPR